MQRQVTIERGVGAESAFDEVEHPGAETTEEQGEGLGDGLDERLGDEPHPHPGCQIPS